MAQSNKTTLPQPTITAEEERLQRQWAEQTFNHATSSAPTQSKHQKQQQAKDGVTTSKTVEMSFSDWMLKKNATPLQPPPPPPKVFDSFRDIMPPYATNDAFFIGGSMNNPMFSDFDMCSWNTNNSNNNLNFANNHMRSWSSNSNRNNNNITNNQINNDRNFTQHQPNQERSQPTQIVAPTPTQIVAPTPTQIVAPTPTQATNSNVNTAPPTANSNYKSTIQPIISTPNSFKKTNTQKQQKCVWAKKPPLPPPLSAVAPESKEEKQRMWREYRQAMKPFKNREFANAKRTIQRLGKRDAKELDEKELARLQRAQETVAAHKMMLSQKSAIRWVKAQDQAAEQTQPLDSSAPPKAKIETPAGQTPAQIYVRVTDAPWSKYVQNHGNINVQHIRNPQQQRQQQSEQSTATPMQNLQWGAGKQRAPTGGFVSGGFLNTGPQLMR